MTNLPTKRYSIIYADPPWSYRDKATAGKRGAGFKYETQSKDWISNLPVQQIARDNSALFLWVTHPQLPVGLEVMSAWGFKYKTVAFTWVKENRRARSLFWGMGNYTRANAEVCLLGLRGRLKRRSAAVHSVIMSPIRRHSQKPHEARERIVRLFGDLPRIELFACEQVPGWDAWGDGLPGKEKNTISNKV